MKVLDLRALPAPLLTRCVTAAVAEHVAGYKWAEDLAERRTGDSFVKGTIALVPPDHATASAEKYLGWKYPTKRRKRSPEWACFLGSPTYRSNWATSADAVLPLLPRTMFGSYWVAHGGFAGVRVVIYLPTGQIVAAGSHDTFPLAACIALLRANGVEVLPMAGPGG